MRNDKERGPAPRFGVRNAGRFGVADAGRFDLSDAGRFRVGDAVTIHTGEKGPQAVATVLGFSHDDRRMELSDGSSWRADGKRQWGFRGSFYRGPFVEPASPGDAERVAKRRLVGQLRKWADGLSVDTKLTAQALARVLAAVEAESAGAGNTGTDTMGADTTGAETTPD